MEKPTTGRALLAGFLVGLLAHPLMWTWYFVVGPPYLPVERMGPAVAAETALKVSLASVLFFGWLTVPVAVACGWVVVRFRRRALE